VEDAAAKAHDELHHYTHCLDLTGCAAAAAATAAAAMAAAAAAAAAMADT
jgi:hypothetical protein